MGYLDTLETDKKEPEVTFIQRIGNICKVLFFSAISIILFVMSIILVAKPNLILYYLNYGWIIAIYSNAFIATIVICWIVAYKANVNDYSQASKISCAVASTGVIVGTVLMSIGLAFIPVHVYTYDNAAAINKFISHVPNKDINFNIPENFKASEGLEIEDGYVVGKGTCTDTYVFIDKPVKEHAFDDVGFNCDKLYLLDGCSSIGEQAFRKCYIYYDDVYFLQNNVLEIPYDVLGYTWNYSNFKLHVPEKLYNDYYSINESTWQTYVVEAGKLKIYTIDQSKIVTLTWF